MIHYFISDLHLSDKRPDLIQAFISLTNILKHESKANLDNQHQLHIVGDFYEAWIGDDYQAPWNDLIEQCLIELSNAGCEVLVYHGNRDFLLGQTWANRVGAKLIKDDHHLDYNNRKVFISHGDQACLDDIEYQKFRSMVRQEQWQQQVLSMPLEQRIALASQLREDSKQSNSEKMLDIMDVNFEEIERLMSFNQSNLMIHGHTHRPNLHTQDKGSRLVLGDWDKTAWFAILNDSSLTQYNIELESLESCSTGLKELLLKANKAQTLKL
ncbi:MAG: UDP-2,3-diacylglucosamine diphosphatase [Marinomonas sp.]|jgi:UDP-2,3-diacylglucosamine hydrolase